MKGTHGKITDGSPVNYGYCSTMLQRWRTDQTTAAHTGRLGDAIPTVVIKEIEGAEVSVEDLVEYKGSKVVGKIEQGIRCEMGAEKTDPVAFHKAACACSGQGYAHIRPETLRLVSYLWLEGVFKH